MGISLKDYIKAMLIKYREYPEMEIILKEIYEEWYGSSRDHANITHGNFCTLDRGSCST